MQVIIASRHEKYYDSVMETQKAKVLIVDDDPFVRDMLADIYQSNDYPAETAENGRDGLEKLSADKGIEVVVSDMNMPVMSGLELLKAIRLKDPDLPVIILTGNNEIAVAIEAMNSGANDYLLKDENIQDTLLLSTKSVLEKHELKKLNRSLMDDLVQKNKEVKKSYLDLQSAHSELKKAQSQILQQEKMASVGRLAAGIAHEINNPMGFITSNLKTFDKFINRLNEFILYQSKTILRLNADKPLPELEAERGRLKIDYILDDTGQLLKESFDGAERIKKIVQDLKNFSQVDAAECLAANINAGIEDTLKILSSELEKKASLKRQYGEVPLTICNPGQLNQVFFNVLTNAIQAIDKKGEITVKTWHDKGLIHIAVSDTGCGIHPDNIKSIFEPFFTTKAVGQGQGLGLSVAYDIVKKHDGDITVQSEVGKGTTFTVKIPVKDK